jgi:predicted transcriptional regulator
MSRPKGSKNKPKENKEVLEIKKDPSVLPSLFGSEKEIKKEIRKLKKLKKQCRPGTTERIDLHRKIKELQALLEDINVVDNDKDAIIAEIMRLDKVMASIDIDLRKHSIKDLQKHLDKLKEKK